MDSVRQGVEQLVREVERVIGASIDSLEKEAIDFIVQTYRSQYGKDWPLIFQRLMDNIKSKQDKKNVAAEVTWHLDGTIADLIVFQVEAQIDLISSTDPKKQEKIKNLKAIERLFITFHWQNQKLYEAGEPVYFGGVPRILWPSSDKEAG